MTDPTPAAMAHAVGAAEPVLDGEGHGRIDPPPTGLTYVLLVGGPVAHIDVGLDRRSSTVRRSTRASAPERHCRGSTTAGPTSSPTRSRSQERRPTARSSDASTTGRQRRSWRQAASRSASTRVSRTAVRVATGTIATERRTSRARPSRRQRARSSKRSQSARRFSQDGWRGRSATRQALVTARRGRRQAAPPTLSAQRVQHQIWRSAPSSGPPFPSHDRLDRPRALELRTSIGQSRINATT